VIKVTMTIEMLVDLDGFGSAYTNEDYLVNEIKEHIEYASDRFGAEEVTFNKIDVEGL
jgi:hypothetical protein